MKKTNIVSDPIYAIYAATGCNRASRIGKFTIAAKPASTMSAYHIHR